jgi:hypothetical protein
MKEDPVIQALAIQFATEIKAADAEAARQQLVDTINELIIKDFEKLVSILYRIDVSEPKIQHLLKTFPQQDAAGIIAGLVIEREAEKIKSRQQYGKKDDGFTGEEKW